MALDNILKSQSGDEALEQEAEQLFRELLPELIRSVLAQWGKR